MPAGHRLLVSRRTVPDHGDREPCGAQALVDEGSDPCLVLGEQDPAEAEVDELRSQLAEAADVEAARRFAEPLRALGVNINAAMVEAKGLEMGLSGANDKLTDGLGNTVEQVDALIDAVAASAAHLRRLSPVYA